MTFGSYATAPRRRVSVSLIVVFAFPLTEERQTADGLADEVVEHVRGRGHHGRGARVAEVSLDADLLSEGRAAADAHRQLRHLGRGVPPPPRALPQRAD